MLLMGCQVSVHAGTIMLGRHELAMLLTPEPQSPRYELAVF